MRPIISQPLPLRGSFSTNAEAVLSAPSKSLVRILFSISAIAFILLIISVPAAGLLAAPEGVLTGELLPSGFAVATFGDDVPAGEPVLALFAAVLVLSGAGI